MGTLATRSNLLSVDTTLDEDITATQNYIPVASTANFSTSVVAEVETTNEVVSFSDISENLFEYSEQFDNSYFIESLPRAVTLFSNTRYRILTPRIHPITIAIH